MRIEGLAVYVALFGGGFLVTSVLTYLGLGWAARIRARWRRSRPADRS